MLSKIFSVVIPLLTAIPTLIQGVEQLWKGTPKAGAQKWISVEQALSGSIQQIAAEVQSAVPNQTADDVATKAAIWAKAVNDATVTFFNETGLLTTTTRAS